MNIIIASTDSFSLTNFRGNLIKEWVKLGHSVTCISTEPASMMEHIRTELGVNYYQVKGDRIGVGFFSGFVMIRDYQKAFRQIEPDLCYFYMSKPVAFGGLAAILCKVPRMTVFVTGLESAFYYSTLRDRLVRFILKTLFTIVHKHCEKVFFSNPFDMKLMIKKRIVSPEKAVLVNGSGVDMTRFPKMPMPNEHVVLMVARLVWNKGIREYIEAAKIVKSKSDKNVRFILVGSCKDSGEKSLPKETLENLIAEKIIEYHDFTNDVRPYYKECSIFALPSYYEGKARSILEAHAVGRPVVTTTAPGCGDAVVDGCTGFVVPVRDAEALAEAILKLVNDQALTKQMGENAYEYCKKTYDVNLINDIFLKELNLK
jgi:glycosyltransferase involved in cell wall biosynthesis